MYCTWHKKVLPFSPPAFVFHITRHAVGENYARFIDPDPFTLDNEKGRDVQATEIDNGRGAERHDIREKTPRHEKQGGREGRGEGSISDSEKAAENIKDDAALADAEALRVLLQEEDINYPQQELNKRSTLRALLPPTPQHSYAHFLYPRSDTHRLFCPRSHCQSRGSPSRQATKGQH